MSISELSNRGPTCYLGLCYIASSARHPRVVAALLHLLAQRKLTIFTHLKALGSRLSGELESFKSLLQRSPEPELSWDFFSVRRTALRVWWVLRREHASPSRLAVAIFVGVLIGCSPFYGFHVILCLVIAFVFRLNKFVVWLGSNVSLPVFAPFLTFVSIQCGHLLLHGEPAEVSLQQIQETGALELFWYWTIGFLPVGSLLGAFFALIVFFKLPSGEDLST